MRKSTVKQIKESPESFPCSKFGNPKEEGKDVNKSTVDRSLNSINF